MTYEEAYLDGFCKAAEVAGVNPVQLYKAAGGASALATKLIGLLAKGKSGLSAGTAAAKGVGGKALAAGQAAAGKAVAGAKGVADKAVAGAKDLGGKALAAGQAAAGKAVAGAKAAPGVAQAGGKRYLELLLGGNKGTLAGYNAPNPFPGAMDNIRQWSGRSNTYRQLAALVDKVRNPAAKYVGALKGNMGGDVASELRKVLAARLGTAGAVGGAGYGIGSALTGDDK